MRICFVAPSSSVHTEKWCEYFASRGHEVSVISFDEVDSRCAATYHLRQNASAEDSDASKVSYLLCGRQLNDYLDEINPDIIHAHYASSYGALCAIACRRPYFLSVWGSDVYDFPRKTVLHKALLRFSLSRATRLFSTSNAMADEAKKYTNRSFIITPFGVDTKTFAPIETTASSNFFNVGTVKGLSSKYGISTLLKACALARQIEPEMPLNVRIAGKGPDEQKLRQTAVDLGLEEYVEWFGFVEPEKVPAIWRSLDVALIPSELESFGVSAVEAQSCGVPVVISDIPGLMEATHPDARMIIPRGNVEQLADAIVVLFRSPDRRQAMGLAGREFVCEQLDLGECFARIEIVYNESLGKSCG